MRGGKKTKGYTIVEVMIFLAISGLMFVMAASFISGRQARSEFRQGMNAINTQIQQTIGDVSNGFYPTAGNFVCVGTASGPVFGSGTAAEQGAKKGCTFIGKVMQFGSTDSGKYDTYVVAGLQFKDADPAALTPPQTFSDAKPKIAPGLTQTKNFEWGLQLDKIYLTDSAHEIGAVGFFSGFSSSTSDNKLESGAAAPIAVAFEGSTLGQTEPNLVTQLDTIATPGSVINPNPQIIMCFKGAANQYGRLNIGSSDNVQGQRLTTHMQISSGAPTGICPQ